MRAQTLTWPAPPRSGVFSASARPLFLYVMYILLLGSLPIGLLAAVDPSRARDVADLMGRYFSVLPDALYALFGSGYLGYTAARQWGKVKGVEA